MGVDVVLLADRGWWWKVGGFVATGMFFVRPTITTLLHCTLLYFTALYYSTALHSGGLPRGNRMPLWMDGWMDSNFPTFQHCHYTVLPYIALEGAPADTYCTSCCMSLWPQSHTTPTAGYTVYCVLFTVYCVLYYVLCTVY